MTASSIDGVRGKVVRAHEAPQPSCTCDWSQPGLILGMTSKSSTRIGPPEPAKNTGGLEGRVGFTADGIVGVRALTEEVLMGPPR